MVFLLAIHLLAAMFWVGGMAFAYWVLRPAAAPLDQAARLALWRRVFGAFLPLVGLAVAALLATGYAMIMLFFYGFAGAPLYVNIMQVLGLLMMLLYLHLMFAPWTRFRRALEQNKLPEAAASLERIRLTVAINLALGIVTAIVGGTGRYW